MILISFAILLLSSLATAMDNTSKKYEFSCATQDDINDIVHLIDTYGVQDADKIVILPKQFRHQALAKSISEKRLFIARDITEKKNSIVGFKKLFILQDTDERNEIMENEIRCSNTKSVPVFEGTLYNNTVLKQEYSSPIFQHDDTYIYNGGDFTHPDYRKNGINESLTHYAFSTILSEKKPLTCSSDIHLLFGIVQANGGSVVGGKGDRAIKLGAIFSHHLKQLTKKQLDPLIYRRYKAFMPTFDPLSSRCEPLPDEKSIPGYGCVLTYKNTPNNKKATKEKK